MSHIAHPDRRRLRRISSILAVALVAVVSTLTGLIPTPTGGEEAGAQAVPAGTPGVTRYFGRGAYEGIRAAVAATPRSCALTNDALAALVMAPIFKEVSMAETPQTAPSPMTLSRWDEWSGQKSGSNNLNANYGLYAFRDPNTPYKRAYWTPGVGIFQYDVAGVGKPFTAAEMMNVKFIAGDVAAGMANRYCAAGGDSYANRAAAWQPWSGLGGVAKSEALFQEMVGLGHPPFSTIGLVDGIENAGGMQTHTCQVGGVPTPCDFVDPRRRTGRQLVGERERGWRRGGGRRGPPDGALLRREAERVRGAALARSRHGLRHQPVGPPGDRCERAADGRRARVGPRVVRLVRSVRRGPPRGGVPEAGGAAAGTRAPGRARARCRGGDPDRCRGGLAVGRPRPVGGGRRPGIRGRP